MELLLDTSKDPVEDRVNWDIDVADGIAVCVPEGAEQDQEASVTAFLETSTIPLMEERGIDWIGYLNKRKTLSEIDNEIRENIRTYLDTAVYAPVFTADNGALQVHMSKIIVNTGAING